MIIVYVILYSYSIAIIAGNKVQYSNKITCELWVYFSNFYYLGSQHETKLKIQLTLKGQNWVQSLLIAFLSRSCDSAMIIICE